ncbi:programmed cell death protein 7-like isoform X3 [Macrobrachium rosenbergii]|uniref:programmed cell death protein 7-like isoform X3 n=1 Tax=Macrobrachium rosenbergii TaxID=79674 RepID=UPI0034D5DDF8
MKKRHKLTVKEKKEQRELWKKEGERIDAWREKIRQVEEDKRREIAVKMEADTILGEVRQKQVDVVKMQQLLESLISLRIARLNKGAAHGFVATPQQDHLFTMTIKNIAEVVNAQMDEYKLEEQTLRVMMEESTSYRRSNAGKEPKDAVSKLESSIKKILFGDMASTDQICDEYTAAEHCLETLVKRRRWDKELEEKKLAYCNLVSLAA